MIDLADNTLRAFERLEAHPRAIGRVGKVSVRGRRGRQEDTPELPFIDSFRRTIADIHRDQHS